MRMDRIVLEEETVKGKGGSEVIRPENVVKY